MLVDTGSFEVITVPQARHRRVVVRPPIRACATPKCDNEGPLATPIVAAPAYWSSDDANKDARCRSCVDSITFLLDPFVAGGDPATLSEVRARVLGYDYAALRGVIQ